MPETKQNTAMMQLRDRLQARLRISTNKDYQDCYNQTINLITSEMMEIEKQQHIDTFEEAISEGRPINAEQYFNQTFNPK